MEMGTLMKKFVIAAASIFGVAGAAVAADLPVRQPVPSAPPPVIGKAPIGKGPIGKGPIGKAPIGKFPIGKAPPIPGPAPGPIVTKG
jgi:opacity protein-like surface antigen